MANFETQRARMVEQHLVRRGITDERLLEAFRSVPREDFLPLELRARAYDDRPLPIGERQTISQPYIVAVTLQALRLQGDENVLEVGTGSGYSAALLSQLARKVYTIERLPALAARARERLSRPKYANVELLESDGSLGWLEHAPFDAIAVAASGPRAPVALLDQLVYHGRLVMPIGQEDAGQVLVRITRESATEYTEEELAVVRFVPLIGEQAFWAKPLLITAKPSTPDEDFALAKLVRECAEPIANLESRSIQGLLERIGRARVVLLGESTHGTSEFYRMRADITKRLLSEHGFSFVAVEADWPDAARVDDYALGAKPRHATLEFAPFSRFPSWMWRNEEVFDFVQWLRAFNAERQVGRVGFHGLDLYSMFTSIGAVLSYLERVDPDMARVARERYSSLLSWRDDPSEYGRAVLVGGSESAESEVVEMLRELLARRSEYAVRDGERFFDAAQNARLVANAERYYRALYQGAAMSWNLRDSHMFETLRTLLAFYGPRAKGVVWEHNTHVGNARATAMGARGEHNVGQLSREVFGDDVAIVGFGTDHGSVAAARDWGAAMEVMQVKPARPDSYEYLFHASGLPACLLPLRSARRTALIAELGAARLERAIGVIYRPQSELASHYFEASLPAQFDDYIWFDETHAITPLPPPPRLKALPDTFPFAH
jgi:protein-L-isoaspartate(D-aspartate) O-methyltransferase